MCSPGAIIGSILGGVVSSSSSRQQRKAMAAQARAEALQAQQNARAAALEQQTIAQREAAAAAAAATAERAELESATPTIQIGAAQPGGAARRRASRASFGIDQGTTGAAGSTGLRI